LAGLIVDADGSRMTPTHATKKAKRYRYYVSASLLAGPSDPAFTKDAGWEDAFDDLRVRPRKRGERLGDWRRDAPIRSIAFKPPVMSDGRDASDVVQVHLEHRLVRRLLSRFLSQLNHVE
jgi:hypothetical protein